MEIQLKGELLAAAKKGHGNRTPSWISAFFPVGMALLAGMAVLAFAPTASAAVIKSPANNLGLVGYWAFEDATGTKATDFSGRGNTGTLTNMDSATDWVDGKVGRALDFDGTDDYVKIGNSLGITGSASLTVAFWVKPTNVATGGVVAGLVNSNPNFAVFVGPLGGTGGSGSVSVEYQSCGEYTANSVVSSGVWQHVVVVKTPGTVHANTIIYVNGLAQSHTNEFGDCNPSFGGSNSFNMGSGWNSDADYPFAGAVDEVRVYNRALSATEVSSLYNSGATKVKARDNSGLLGYWSFEDATGTQATDFSGNGKTATLTGGPTWVAGKRGKAVSFDGTNDAVEMPTSFSFGALPLTMSFWTYPTSASQAYFTSDGGFSDHGFYFSTYNGGGMYVGYYISNWSTALENIASFTQNTWSHVVLTIDSTNGSRLYVNGVLRNSNATPPTGTNTTNWRLGTQFNWAHYFQGKMDDIRMYNRALTAQQVADLYNAGAMTANPTIKTVSRNGLVGYWNLDDGTSTIATDFSGNGKTGTLTNGPTWVTGKRGKAVSFDGIDDYVTLGDFSSLGSSAKTLSLWIKPDDITTDRRIISNTSGTDFSIRFSSGAVQMWGNWETIIPTAGPVGEWTYYTFVFNGAGGVTAYKNGIANSLVTSSANWRTLALGAPLDFAYGSYFDGQIDDVRIYNRALSAEEIQLLYTIGK